MPLLNISLNKYGKSVLQQAGLLLHCFLQPHIQTGLWLLPLVLDDIFQCLFRCYVLYFLLETTKLANVVYAICSVNYLIFILSIFFPD